MKHALRAAAVGALLTLSPGSVEGENPKPQQPDKVETMPRAELEKEVQGLRARVKILIQRLESAHGKKVLEDGCPQDCQCNRCCGSGVIMGM